MGARVYFAVGSIRRGAALFRPKAVNTRGGPLYAGHGAQKISVRR